MPRLHLQVLEGDAAQLGDISREIERRRVEWVTEYLGKQDYAFGDITKKFVADFTGEEEYEFGDITKKAVSAFTGKDTYQVPDVGRACLAKWPTRRPRDYRSRPSPPSLHAVWRHHEEYRPKALWQQTGARSPRA